jgi:predicted polyphosphate/ATP-dependent NAD kinase
VERARALGGVPTAPGRATQTLSLLRDGAAFEVLTAGGPMGADPAVAAGLRPITVYEPDPPSTAADTVATAERLATAGVDLVLFVGGDGTAADLLGIDVPVLGVPAGVKMYSSVFATGPRAAAEVAAAFLAHPARDRCDLREVLDVDEAALRRDERVVRLLGTLLVPAAAGGLQALKASGATSDAAALPGLGWAVAARLRAMPASFAILGPGTTVAAVAAALGVPKTLLGVDLVEVAGDAPARIVMADAAERALLDALGGRMATIVLSPTGGQGFLLGRGNQQLSPAVVHAVGLDRILIAATPAKLAALGGRPLLVDSGDDALDRALRGHRRVIMGPGHEAVAAIEPA